MLGVTESSVYGFGNENSLIYSLLNIVYLPDSVTRLIAYVCLTCETLF